MWARDVEFMLGCWLAASPFIFRHAKDAMLLWITDFTSAALVCTLAVLSYWRPTRHAHLLTILVALWLVGFGRFGAAAPLPPGMQNEIAVGLLLLMFVIIPNRASQPPAAWYAEPRRAWDPADS
jgi:hypothetical protein